MATSLDFIEYVCDQIEGAGEVRYRKMFGEYVVYVDEKPVLTVCDNTVFVKKFDCISQMLHTTGRPYEGAKEHYILDIDDTDLCKKVISLVKPVILQPKPKKPKGFGGFRS